MTPTKVGGFTTIFLFLEKKEKSRETPLHGVLDARDDFRYRGRRSASGRAHRGHS